jgi:hypothetical protein
MVPLDLITVAVAIVVTLVVPVQAVTSRAEATHLAAIIRAAQAATTLAVVPMIDMVAEAET